MTMESNCGIILLFINNNLETKPVYSMTPLQKIIKKAENLLIQIEIETEKTHEIRGIPIETYKNDCLNYAERVNNLRNITRDQKVDARKRIFEIYFKLQDFKGSERQTRAPWRETPFSSLQSANAYKGGLGFSGIADGLFLQSSGPKTNQYWKPTEMKPVRKVPKKEHAKIMEDYEERRSLSLAEFHEEMDRQKREVLYEVRKLRETSDTDKRRVLIL